MTRPEPSPNATVEPLSRRDHSVPLNVSLRGSLAGECYERHIADGPDTAADFVRSLLSARDPDLLRFVENNTLVIARVSERGLFFPDW